MLMFQKVLQKVLHKVLQKLHHKVPIQFVQVFCLASIWSLVCSKCAQVVGPVFVEATANL